MAARAGAKKKAKGKKKIPMRGDPRQSSRGKVAKVAKKRGRGDNSGIHALGDDDVLYHQDQLDAARKRMKTVQEELTQLRGVYQSKRKTAKSSGFNLNAYDINAKLENLDLGKVQVDYADAGRYLKVRGSALAEQLQLFQNMEAPVPEVDALLQGEQAGREAVDAGNNPFKPGTEHFQQWADGWAKGQLANASKIGKSETPTLQ